MTDENETQTSPEETVTVTEGPDQDATALPGVTEEEAPGDSETPPKSFTQEELDEIVAKRIAKAERQWRRGQAQQTEQQPDGFSDDGESLTTEQIIARYEAVKGQREVEQAYSEREETALEKYDDFEQVAYNQTLPVTEVMKITIMESEQGPDVLYWLGSNPKEAARISRLSPAAQAKEIGRIEARLEMTPPAPKASKAPAPINPITPKGNGSPAYDTTDPRSVESMSTSEWIEAERRRTRARMQGSNATR